MSKNENALSVVKLSGKLDVADIISVVTSRAETKFHGELEVTKVRIVEAQATVKQLDSEACALFKKECRALADAMAKKLRPGVESVGGKVTVVAKDSYEVNERRRDGDGFLTQDVKVTSNTTGRHNSQMCFKATGEPSKALVALEESVKQAQATIGPLQTEALTWRRKLANVPLLERRARAKIAEAKLSESADGQQLLDLLTDDLEQELLALPSS
jgi:hypothetical protein